MGIRERKWSAPVQVEGRYALPGRAGELSIASASGHWSNCDVYLLAPDSWGAVNQARIKVYSFNGAARYALATNDLWLSPYTQHGNGQRTWLVASVRGHPADGFEVTATSPAGIDLPACTAYLECWGQESTPEVLTMSAESSVLLRGGELMLPRRQAHLTYYDGTAARHRLVVGDQFGGIWTAPSVINPAGQGSSSGRIDQEMPVTGAGALRWVQCQNNAGALRWLQVFDRGAPLAGAEIPLFQRPMDASVGVAEFTFPGDGWAFVDGLVLGCSTTADTFTAAASGWFSWLARV